MENRSLVRRRFWQLVQSALNRIYQSHKHIATSWVGSMTRFQDQSHSIKKGDNFGKRLPHKPGLSGDLSSRDSVGAATDTGCSSSVFVGDASCDFGSTGAVSLTGDSAGVGAACALATGALGGDPKLGTNSIAFTFNVENLVDISELPSCAIIAVSLYFRFNQMYFTQYDFKNLNVYTMQQIKMIQKKTIECEEKCLQ